MGMDEEGERLDVFPVRVLVERGEGEDELEESGGSRQELAWVDVSSGHFSGR